MLQQKAVVDLLLWAAGGDVAPPDLRESDCEQLAAALHSHRLDARFLRRARVDGVEVPHVLARRLTERLAGIRRDVDKRAALARTLSALASPDDHRRGLITLKGFTLLGLTGGEQAVRHSGDLDVLVGDPAEFVQRALTLGFTIRDRMDVLDEYARLVHDEHGMVEVHSYYAVPSWRSRATEVDCDPKANPDRWVHGVSLGETRLHYADIVDDLVPAPALEGGGWVLRPEVAVLVQAAHLHGDYVRAVLPEPMGTARLDEIATVLDFCALPGFDFGYLAELVDRFQAHDVVAFARALAVDLLDRDPFPPGTGLDLPDGRFFPVDLWWDGVEGLLVDLGWNPLEIVVRSEPPLAVLERLGACRVPVTDVPREVSAATGTSSDLDRYVLREGRSGHFDVRCAPAADDRALSLTISVPAAADDRMMAVSLNFGDYRFEFFHRNAENDLQFDDYSLTPVEGPPVERSARRVDGRDVLTVRIPWVRLGDTRPADLPLLLGVRRQVREWGATDGVAILPLRLTWGAA
ncbi:nucleotidyltransferase family protein [Saccharothrix sp. NRRL B-16314]|uniref:nucleotidyltransferase family protein n=1 Tax=Saccharothrix sp. NRRL B-16314 TaxID=1463825 RepID=UPI0005268E08|nr:nucleotidyltransferase family protein [Saccharothrix sp. NRRL B-16314]